jgi:hypothetical protein
MGSSDEEGLEGDEEEAVVSTRTRTRTREVIPPKRR